MVRRGLCWGLGCLVSVLLALASVAWANPTDTATQAAEEQQKNDAAAPAAEQPAPDVGTWHVREVEGCEYVPLEDIRSFYKPFSRICLYLILLSHEWVQIRLVRSFSQAHQWILSKQT